MKRIGYIYEKMCSPELIREAIFKAARGKRKRHDVKRVLADVDKHVAIIQELLEKQEFEPAPYFVSERYDPHNKKTRIIQRPKFFPDQVIHWIVVLSIQPTLMRGMYHWSCGSIPGRGSGHGQKAVRRWLKNDRKNTKYCLKLDIRHFYDTIPHDLLKKALRRKIKDERALWLIGEIIDSTPVGVPIGNYTSQWLANFYLETLDHYIKERLGAKYYVRYIDDIVIFGRNKKQLHALRKKLFAFIEEELGLEVKGNWQVFPVDARGVDFLGYVFRHDYIKMRDRNFLALTRQCRRVKKKLHRGDEIPYRMAAGLISRAGQLKHCNSQHIKHRYYDGIKEKRLKEVIRIESKRQLRAA
ncbi:RNA-directed DNA polymerase [Clostridium sp. D33t1_170424_F3]|uniref:RNA-directed DNA polymerase n=1 Tax=Clostridium sp. D33t1_170424_F3 TaxID=2787099 RepID=UPI0018AA7F3C|nr:RNA-directed DNA polymerase [Clostridium sp. D33t1_170424_F3]